MLERQSRAQKGAHHVGDRHRQKKSPPDVPRGAKEGERPEVRHHVEHLRARRGVEVVEAEQADHEEDQETARAGAEEAVVQPHHQRDPRGDARLRAGPEARGMPLAHVAAEERDQKHRAEHEGERPPQPVGRDERDQPGADHAAEEGHADRGQKRGPREPHVPRVVDRGRSRAADHRGLVRAEEHGRFCLRKHPQEHRKGDQSSATCDRVHETRKQRAEREGDGFKFGHGGRQLRGGTPRPRDGFEELSWVLPPVWVLEKEAQFIKLPPMRCR